MCKAASSDRKVGDLHGGHQTAQLEVEVLLVPEIVIEGDLGNEVGSDVRRAGIVGGVKLWSQLRVEGKGENNLASAYELLRVFDADGPCHVVIEVVGCAE